MNILVLDFETTGLNPEHDRITEYGIAVYNTEDKNILYMESQLVKLPNEFVISEHVVKLNGITQAMLDNNPTVPESYILQKLDYIYKSYQCSCFLSHYSEFDKSFFNAMVSRNKEQFHTNLNAEKWMCSLRDFPYPPKIKQKSLQYLASDYGFLNPFSHRAMSDVLTVIKIAQNFDLESIYNDVGLPPVYVIAKVSKEDKDKAKSQGFQFDWNNKLWFKELTKTQYEKEKTLYNFPIEIMEVTAQ